MTDLCPKSRLHNILESIMKFLQYDVRTLFGHAGNMICCNMNFSNTSVGPEHDFIEHSYGCRPKIFDGDEEEENEQDQELMEMECCLPVVKPKNECCSKKQKQIQNCSKQMEEEDICDADLENDIIAELSSSEDEDEDMDDCPNDCPNAKSNTTNSCRKVSKAKNICQEIYQKIHSKCSSASITQLTAIEKRAHKLWDCLNKDASSPCPNTSRSTWCKLNAGQKLPFYWAALSDDILTEDPFENFKRFYLPNIPKDKRCTKKTNETLLIVWHSLETEQKMPFVMEAFIGKIGGGKVNIKDEHEIQRIMKRLQRNCT